MSIQIRKDIIAINNKLSSGIIVDANRFIQSRVNILVYRDALRLHAEGFEDAIWWCDYLGME